MFPNIEDVIVKGFNAYTTKRYKEYQKGSERVKASIPEIYDTVSQSWLNRVDPSNPDYEDWLRYVNNQRSLFGLAPLV